MPSKSKTKKTSANKMTKLKKIEHELKEFKDKNVRLLAEFDNYRRRIIEERHHNEKYEGNQIFKNILPILDDIDRVLSLKNIKEQSVIDGINLIKNKFLNILNEHGVKTYDSIGENFNPDLHEAIMMKKSKKGTNIILEEYEKGYMHHDRVIRHSKVIVSE